MSQPENDLSPDLEEKLAGSKRADFVKTLAGAIVTGGGSDGLHEVDRIRRAFDDLQMEEPPPAFAGYTILELLGKGSFGAVYRARDDRLGRDVALKILLPRLQLSQEAKDRFLQEAQALALLRHPNILGIHTVLEQGGRMALVTEFIEGRPLSDHLLQNGACSAQEAAQIGIEVCRALAAAHQARLIHRDVKSANILREKGGRIVLTDFGLGVFAGAPGTEGDSNGVAGSPLFMAPEQVNGEAVEARTDLYALGIVLYHLSTNKYPIEPCDLNDLFARIRSGALKPLRDMRPDLPEGFIRVVEKACSTAPANRYQSAGELEQALVGFLGKVPPAAPRSQPEPPSPGPWRKKRMFFALAGLAAALVVAACLVFQIGSPAGGLDIQAAALLRETGPGRGQQLLEGDPLRKDDQLYFEFEASRPAYVYVLNEDARGTRNLLFPCAGGEPENPLRSGVRHELPGTIGGKKQRWSIDNAGGREWIIVLASLKPLDGLQQVASAPRPAGVALSHPEVRGESLEMVVRGMKVAPQKRDEVLSGRTPLASIIDDLQAARRLEGEEVWVRKFTLGN